MNQDLSQLAQILTNVDARVNSLKVNPANAGNSQMDDISKLRTQMQTRLDTYNNTIAKATEDVRKELEEMARQVEQKINYLMQPQQ